MSGGGRSSAYEKVGMERKVNTIGKREGGREARRQGGREWSGVREGVREWSGVMEGGRRSSRVELREGGRK